ncbi:murein biosynthesis integral membrane protein MurJ [Rhizobium azibense]|uniref:Putative peptidoglycan lipid II flippase n=1 Tax=Rhizobium azibense TaxID=1136135 RepID=A0A4R3R0S1_9HYPH|nr:lipid II flippase MurJ [Rhizobium azibense]TCU27594.1 putative peptidoglycan lipid II flippase [Rhizobium azibense]
MKLFGWLKHGYVSLLLGNLSSKFLGILREGLFAAWFGTGDVAAAYRIAQTGYLLPTHGFIGDSLSAGLLPLYRRLQSESQDAARLLVLIAGLYGLIFSFIVTVAIYYYSYEFAHVLAPGANAVAKDIASNLLKVMALSTPFYVLSGMLSYLEAAYGKYGAIAWRPMILNIGSVAGAAMAVYLKADHWLATTLVISHILFFLRTVFEIRGLDKLTPQSRGIWREAGKISARFLGNMVPLLGLPLIGQSNLVVERIVSSWLGTHIIPSVDYAKTIVDTGTQLLAVPLGIVTMATHGGMAGEEARAFSRRTAGLLMILSFPASVLIALNAEPIVTLIFARGRFDETAIASTSAVLALMVAGLGFSLTSYYLIKVLNAQLRNIESLIITVIAAAINMAINLGLWPYLGPQTIGLGAAGYGFVIFVLCLVRLGFAFELRKLIAAVSVGVIAQALLTVIAVRLIGFPFQLIASFFIAAMIWLPLVLIRGPVRDAAGPLMTKLPVLRRFA